MRVICVQKGRIGTTEYYMGKMPVGELINSVGLAAELPEWDGMTADEKMQREPDLNRIVNEIVPYFVKDPDRFFGCVIVDIFSGFEDMIYEPLKDLDIHLPTAYKFALKDIGLLTLPGKERLIALDGQHRILAMKLAIIGKGAIPVSLLKSKKMTPQMMTLEPHPELAKEEIGVIFVEHRDNLKIRKIFNKVNKYARQTGRGDNIITSDDDIFALISRRLFKKGEVLAAIGDTELVNWKSNTLSERSKQLTTVSVLYTSAEIILKDFKYSANVLPDNNEIERAFKIVKEFWKRLLEGMGTYQQYIQLTKSNQKVSDLRKESLLMKPVTQMALAHVAYMARKKNIEWKDVVEKLNKIDWSFDNPVWSNLLVTGTAKKKMITGKEYIRDAGMVISYMAMGNMMEKQEVAEVREIIRNASNNERKTLPQIIQ